MDKHDLIHQLQACKTAETFEEILSTLHSTLQKEHLLDS